MNSSRSGSQSIPSLLVIGLLSALAGLVIWLVTRPSESPPQAQLAVGGVTYCRGLPRFASALGFSNQMVLTTSEPRLKGLVMYEPAASGAGRVYQHPSWDDAGYLGPIAIDRDGNLYVAPVPRINLVDNPPEKQNIVYRIDTDTGEMTELLELPALALPSPENPYGVLGLTYDCDTHSLYATSVAGSARSREAGRIFRIDLNAGSVATRIENIDAIGVGVLNGAQGKRLYFGAARAPEVRSIALDAGGNFNGPPRVEFSLAALSGGKDEKARRISFDLSGNLSVYAVEFNFSLAASSEPPQTLYRFRYDAEQDRFDLLDTSPN